MANDGFNGTTVQLSTAAATANPLLSASYDDAAAEVQVSGSTSATHIYEAGLPNPTLTLELGGGSTIIAGEKGKPTITWFDGSSDTLTKHVVISRATAGSLDNPITTTLTLRPTTT